MLIAANFHYVRPSFDYPNPGIHGITPDHLEKQLTMLASVGKFVSANEIRAAVRGQDALPEHSFVATFDDGLCEQYEFAWPVLRRMGIPAIFFVNTCPIETATVSMVHKIHLLRAHIAPVDFLAMLEHESRDEGIDIDIDIDAEKATFHYKYDTRDTAQLKYLLNFVLDADQRDRLMEACFRSFFSDRESSMSRQFYMDRAQIRDLADRGCVGSHAHEHVPLGLLADEKIVSNLHLSVERLNSWTGQSPFALSYPYGSREACSVAAGEIAARFGFEFAFTMERAGNPDFRNPLFLARFDNNDLPGGKAATSSVENLYRIVPSAKWYTE